MTGFLTSRTGPALSMVCSTPQPWLPFCDNAVKWCSRKLVDSVLPEPDSPIAFLLVYNNKKSSQQYRNQILFKKRQRLIETDKDPLTSFFYPISIRF